MLQSYSSLQHLSMYLRLNIWLSTCQTSVSLKWQVTLRAPSETRDAAPLQSPGFRKTEIKLLCRYINSRGKKQSFCWFVTILSYSATPTLLLKNYWRTQTHCDTVNSTRQRGCRVIAVRGCSVLVSWYPAGDLNSLFTQKNLPQLGESSPVFLSWMEMGPQCKR